MEDYFVQKKWKLITFEWFTCKNKIRLKTNFFGSHFQALHPHTCTHFFSCVYFWSLIIKHYGFVKKLRPLTIDTKLSWMLWFFYFDLFLCTSWFELVLDSKCHNLCKMFMVMLICSKIHLPVKTKWNHHKKLFWLNEAIEFRVCSSNHQAPIGCKLQQNSSQTIDFRQQVYSHDLAISRSIFRENMTSVLSFLHHG